jgi:hypothetical protein
MLGTLDFLLNGKTTINEMLSFYVMRFNKQGLSLTEQQQ